MSAKITRAAVASIVCVIAFCVSTFVPAVRDSRLGDFVQGFAVGAGAVAIIGFVVLLTKRSTENVAE